MYRVCRSGHGQCQVFVNTAMKLCVFLKGGEFLNQTREHEVSCPMISDSKQRVCVFIHMPVNFRTRELKKTFVGDINSPIVYFLSVKYFRCTGTCLAYPLYLEIQGYS